MATVDDDERIERPLSAPGFVARLQKRLAGTVTISTGVDLTAPTNEVWDAEITEEYLDATGR